MFSLGFHLVFYILSSSFANWCNIAWTRLMLDIYMYLQTRESAILLIPSKVFETVKTKTGCFQPIWNSLHQLHSKERKEIFGQF